VSAALNGKGPVSEETRRRVWEAAAAVGYAPNAIARSLRLGRAGSSAWSSAHPATAHGAESRVVENAAISANYSILVCNSDDREERELAILDQLRAQHVAGILLTPIGRSAGYVQRLSRRDLPPLVAMDQRVPGLPRDFVGVDNRAAVRMLTEFLLRLGHRRIAMISGGEGMWTADERLAGFVETMTAAGVEVIRRSACARAIAASACRDGAAPHPPGPLPSSAPTMSLRPGRYRRSSTSVSAVPKTCRSPHRRPLGSLVRPRITTVTQPIEDQPDRHPDS
jgi:LacI family transcriptional regulator